jgi:amino acid adenylation domain-containing protein
LVEWNNTGSVFPKTKCLHHLIEAQVEQSPEAIAVVFGDGHLTYQELNARANQLAHYLRQDGVGPEVIVGICIERSLELAIAILAVLKAGGAYLPLDPAYPKDRLRFLIKDSRATVVLIQQRFRDLWLAEGVRAICLDSDWPKISSESVENPGIEISSDNLAYVIYTSGSTGVPKGVLVRHRGLVNHNLAVAKLYGLQPRDRMLQFASISFDIAVEEIFPTWITGGGVVFRPEDIALSGKDFLGWLEQAQISVMDLPTAYWHEWVEQISRLGKQLPKSLRTVIVGGEKAQSSVFSTWRKIGGRRVQWFNTYGPTETTIVATAYAAACSDDAQAEIGDLPIGRPIFNTQIYLLDAHLQPVPVGVAGELCIAGEGMARGYLNRPDSTAEKFVPNPFCQEPGGLMYRSGDVARYRRDGNLEFLGRCDDQVKIRGFRVETGEVETAMMEHSNVQQAVVVVDEHKPGEKRLVAYLVLKEPVANAEKEVRAFLKDKLPVYMIPSDYVLLDVLPLSVNGKIDRRLLPPVSTARTEFTEINGITDDPLEHQLQRVFETVLDRRPIGATDSFFELGGHSLLAVRLIEQMEKVVGKPIPLATLIQSPSVRQLANTLRQEGWNPRWSSLVPIQPRGSKPPIFFAHAVGGNVLNYQALPHYLGPDQPVYGLQSQGLDGKHPPYTRVEDMAAHYLREIRSLQPQGPYYLGGMSFGGMVAYEMAQQLMAHGEEVALLAMLDVNGWGYTKMLSRIELFELVLGFWCSRIKFNLASLFKLSSRDRRNYLRGKIRTIRRRINSRQWQDAYLREVNNVHLRTPTLQNVKEANYLAAKTYNPKPYPGHVTVFRATDRLLMHTIAPEVTWKHLALGGVTAYDVPGGHLSMLDEPHVRSFAEKLKACLQHPGKCLLILLSTSNLSPAEHLLSLI